jgi:hypothetical protein
MVEEHLAEPYVLIEAPRTERRLLHLHDGPRPELLLIDRNQGADSDLSPLLFEAGFDVFRIAGLDAAREMIATRSSLVMAVVRLDLPGVDPGATIAELARSRPGLWIGMRAGDGPEEEQRARDGYQAGADDLLPLSVPLPETAERLWRSLPWAIRKRDRAQRRRRRTSALRLPEAACLAGIALAIGILAALGTGAWLDREAREEARLDRVQAALEAGVSRNERPAPAMDRWTRSEELDLERRRVRQDLFLRQEQLDETRLEHLFRNTAPRYPQP